MKRMRLPHWQKKSSVLLMVLVGGLLCSLTGGVSLAIAKDSFKIGVIDPQKVIEKSKAGSRALATLKEHAKARENVLKSDKKELEGLQEELKTAAVTMSDDERKIKQELFTKKLQEFQKRGQEYNVELTEKQRELVQEYMGKIEGATSTVAKRHGFSIVVDKGSDATMRIVLYSRKGLDITNEVIKEFDRRFK